MPLFLLSLPLSVGTFWRYLLILPVLAAGLFVATLLAGLIPFASYVVGPTLLVFAQMVGFHLALRAGGHRTGATARSLLDASLVFFLIGIVVAAGIEVLFALLHLVAGFFGISFVPGAGDDALSTFFAQSWAWHALLALQVLAAPAVACAMAVPMTAAAATANTPGVKAGLFGGMGAGFFSLAVPMTLWAYLVLFNGLLGELMVGGMVALRAASAVLGAEGRDLADFLEIAFRGVLIAWASAWYYATAVLAWERSTALRKTARTEAVATAASTARDDIRALRQSRMRRE